MMRKQFQYPRSNRRSFKRKSQILRIKPEADGNLKKVFAGIGVPEKKPFHPDPFQLQAISTIQGNDCLVTAPTGAGKTWIAEEAIRELTQIAPNLRLKHVPGMLMINDATATQCIVDGLRKVGFPE